MVWIWSSAPHTTFCTTGFPSPDRLCLLSVPYYLPLHLISLTPGTGQTFIPRALLYFLSLPLPTSLPSLHFPCISFAWDICLSSPLHWATTSFIGSCTHVTDLSPWLYTVDTHMLFGNFSLSHLFLYLPLSLLSLYKIILLLWNCPTHTHNFLHTILLLSATRNDFPFLPLPGRNWTSPLCGFVFALYISPLTNISTSYLPLTLPYYFPSSSFSSMPHHLPHTLHRWRQVEEHWEEREEGEERTHTPHNFCLAYDFFSPSVTTT